MSSIPGPNQYLRCENNWKKKVLPFPCKWQDLRVVPMNTYNNGPVSGRTLKKLFSISIFVLDTLIHRVHFSPNVSTCTTVPFNIFTGCVRRWQVQWLGRLDQSGNLHHLHQQCGALSCKLCSVWRVCLPSQLSCFPPGKTTNIKGTLTFNLSSSVLSRHINGRRGRARGTKVLKRIGAPSLSTQPYIPFDACYTGYHSKPKSDQR